MVLWFKQTLEDRSTAKYPEVIANPSLWDTIANVRASNWLYVGAWTCVGSSFAYAYGKKN